MSSLPDDKAGALSVQHPALNHLERRWNGPVIVSYAQNAEDVRLWRVLGSGTTGFYVDVGAGDPVNDSVTKLFYDAGWRGINVEPGPKYELLRTARPDDVNLEVAISKRPGVSQMWVSSPDPGLSSLRRLRDELVPDGYSLISRPVRTARLEDVLERHAQDRAIDFLKIDVEGVERDVLSSFDPGVIRPTVVVVESISPLENRSTHEEWEPLLLDGGYCFAAFDGINRFYVPAEHADLVPALEYPVTILDRFVLHDAGRCGSTRAAADETVDRFSALSTGERDAAKLARDVRAMKQELDAVKGSVSWRITRPLRTIRRTQLVKAGRAARLLDTEPKDTSAVELGFSKRLLQASRLLADTAAPDDETSRVVSIEDSMAQLEDALSSARVDYKAAAWLSLTAADGSYPGEEDVDVVARLLRTSGAKTLAPVLERRLASAMRSGRAATAPLDIVRDGVVVDAEAMVTSDIHTGIQRVARESVSRWIETHPGLQMAYFDERVGALKLLSSGELERMRRWDEHIGDSGTPISVRRPEEASGKTLVPWGSHLIVTELILDPRHSGALRALADSRIHRSLSFICFDLIPIVAAETVDAGLTEGFCEYLSAVKRADRVSAISRQSARDFGAFSAMVAGEGLQGPAVEAHLLPMAVPRLTESDLDSGLASLELRGIPLVLVVGVHVPRKNHLAVLEACERLWNDGQSFELLMIGGFVSTMGREFEPYVRRLKSEGWPIRIKRRASEAELWAAYRAARFTVYPSLLEGYGLPVAESLASGTPVIASRHGCVAEVANGGGALLIDPRDVDDITDQMRRLLEDDDLLERLRGAAISRDLGSWDDYARDVWRFFVGDAG